MILKIAFKLISPYWRSADKKNGLLLIAGILAIAGAESFLRIWYNDWYIDYFNSLQKLDADKYWRLLPVLLIVAAIALAMNIAQEYAQNWLELRWRRGMVSDYISRWTQRKSYYRVERNQESDNPDQRISEDIRHFVNLTINLSIGLVTMLMTLWSFSYLTWTKGGSIDISIAGSVYTIHGYMFWAALLFALVHIGLTHLAGRRLISINFISEAKEADFRYKLVQVRDNAEQIAMYSGEEIEKKSLMQRFSEIWAVYKRSYLVTAQLSFVNGTVNTFGTILPIVIMTPQLFSGKLDLGTVMGTAAAWSNLTAGFAWLATRYSTIAQWRATTARLDELSKAIDRPESERGIQLEKLDTPVSTISVDELSLTLPDGSPLTKIGEIRVQAGDRWMITGPTGAGKSTLLRAIAGLWPYGTGFVRQSTSSKVMFLPQKSYIASGTLKAALCYPEEEGRYSDAECKAALIACRLPHMVDRLYEEAQWSKTMSLGEQQRVAFARAWLAKPDVLFLDEATSSVDPETENVLYTEIRLRLRMASIVSVAHRSSLKEHHTQFLAVQAG